MPENNICSTHKLHAELNSVPEETYLSFPLI